jgi:hypothetical protein
MQAQKKQKKVNKNKIFKDTNEREGSALPCQKRE